MAPARKRLLSSFTIVSDVQTEDLLDAAQKTHAPYLAAPGASTLQASIQRHTRNFRMLHAETPVWLVLRQSHLETMLTILSSIPALLVVSNLPQRLKLPLLIYFVLQILS